MNARIPALLRQWCRTCQAVTDSKPCSSCGAPFYACAVCGYHIGHNQAKGD